MISSARIAGSRKLFSSVRLQGAILEDNVRFRGALYRSRRLSMMFHSMTIDQWLKSDTTEEIVTSLIHRRRRQRESSKQLQDLYQKHLGAQSNNYSLCRLDNGSFHEDDLFQWFSQSSVVHAVKDIDALRQRKDPTHQRLYGLFHKAQPLQNTKIMPSVVLQVSLQPTVPSTLRQVLYPSDKDSRHPSVATFYSISLLEPGLGGLGLGELTLHLAMKDLPDDTVQCYVSLSPLSQPFQCPVAAAKHLLARNDTIGRFHLGNGAQVYRINPPDEGFGGCCNVNYRYEAEHLEERRQAFQDHGTVNMSEDVIRLLRHDE